MDEGLEGVVAARTVLSDVDGEAGRLVIRGWPLERIAGTWRFEQALALLLQGFFDEEPEAHEADEAHASLLQAALGAARVQAAAVLRPDDAQHLQPLADVEIVRALLARLPDGDDLPTALRLAAGMAVFTAAVARWRAGAAAVPPDAGLSQAADLLRMSEGRPPEAARVAALDTYLVTVCDHGLNAGTFAARVVASTGAGLASAVMAGLCALKGPLHGGAPGPVLDMLDAIGTPEQARPWLQAALARGDRLMGFGHRIYRVRDPRADALKSALQRLWQASQASQPAGGSVEAPARLALATAVEQAALAALRESKPGRSLDTNVEFYTAVLLDALGFRRESFTAVFACGRVAGWLAHAREQVRHGRLIRPQSVYVGPAPAR